MSGLAMIPACTTDNYFYALMADPVAAPGIFKRGAATVRKHALNCPVIGADRLHISLVALNRASSAELSAEIERTMRAAASVRSPAFQATFDCALSFKRKQARPYVLSGGAGLDSVRTFQRSLCMALGLRPGSFRPHMTLFYSVANIPEHPISPHVSFPVREFVLVHSFVRQRRYEFLGRWPLTGT